LKRYLDSIFILLFFVPVSLKAQEQEVVVKESVGVENALFINVDSLVVDSVQLDKKDLAFLNPEPTFVPNPKKAVIYSAIFPGLGQIYNRKYWKLPFVYGGFLGCTYAITWNGNQFNGYKKAYRDFIDGDDTTNTWEAYRPYSLRKDLDEWTQDEVKWFSSTYLKSRRDYYQRYRDLSIFITIGVYAICMIDAYVDAQLFSFDVTPDLSMRVDPVLFDRTSVNSRSMGMQLSFTF
jgi:hypothetical protein